MEFSKLIMQIRMGEELILQSQDCSGKEKTVMGMGGLPLRYRAGVIIAEHCIRMKSPERRQKCRIGGLGCF